MDDKDGQDEQSTRSALKHSEPHPSQKSGVRWDEVTIAEHDKVGDCACPRRASRAAMSGTTDCAAANSITSASAALPFSLFSAGAWHAHAHQ